MTNTERKLTNDILLLKRAITELHRGGQYNLDGGMPLWHLKPACDAIADETEERLDPENYGVSAPEAGRNHEEMLRRGL